MMNRAAFHTIEIPEIDKPRTYETDGPAGFVNFMFTSEFYGCAAYCSETLVGMTFNQELAEEWGETVGEESLWGDITTVNGEVVTVKLNLESERGKGLNDRVVVNLNTCVSVNEFLVKIEFNVVKLMSVLVRKT